MSSIRRDNKATCASGLPVSVADEPYFAMISFFTSGVNAISFPFHSVFLTRRPSGFNLGRSTNSLDCMNSRLRLWITQIERDLAVIGAFIYECNKLWRGNCANCQICGGKSCLNRPASRNRRLPGARR